jgi:hypothetical protein
MTDVSAMPYPPQRAARRGSCLGRIERTSPLPPPQRPTKTNVTVSAPSSDSAPTRPRRSMSPVPARPASADLQESQAESPGETDKIEYGYGDDGPDKIEYGYGDVEPENGNGTRSTRTLPSMERPHVPIEKAQRRGSAFGRLQILPEEDTPELERVVSIYEDNIEEDEDEDEDVRFFVNKIAHLATSDSSRARVRRRGSALGRFQADSTLTSSFRAELDKSVYGYEDADAGTHESAKSVYEDEDAGANRKVSFTHSPQEAKARRRGSALGRLQEDSTVTSSTRAAIQELDKSVYGYEDVDAGSQETDKAVYGYENADTGSQDMNEADYGYEDADANSNIDANRNMTCTHSSREIKARRRGSALGRLQEDTTLAIPNAAPPQQPNRRRMSVGENNPKWSSTNLAIPDAAPPRHPSRRRMSVGANDVPIGDFQDFSERYAGQSSTNQASTTPAPIRRGSRRMSIGASGVPLGNIQENCTKENSGTQATTTPAPLLKGSRRRMSVGATSLPPKAIPVEPNVSAQSRQNESKEQDSCDVIRQRAPGRVNRRGSACGRLQSWDGEAPCVETLDRILLAQVKMGLDPSKTPLPSKKLRGVNEYSIPW